MKTRKWTQQSRQLLTLLAALMLLGMSACGDDDNGSAKDNNDADLCQEVSCEALAAECAGDTAISYSGAGICDETDGTCDYSKVKVETDCTESGEICHQGACVPPDTDLCEDVSCEAPAAECTGDTAISYSGAGQCQAADGTCDFSQVRVETDCTETDEICLGGACVPPGTDLCEDVSCDAPEAECADSTTAISYSGAGQCQAADGTCDFSQVRVETDCTETDEICHQGACVPPDIDLCEDVSCDAPAAECAGDTAISYSGAGQCQAADGTCDFSQVRVETDCTETGQSCVDGACVDEHRVNPGDLVITEFMADPAAVGDAKGEYFEVYNTTSRTLYLSGLLVKDDGRDSFRIQSVASAPVAIAPNAYFVFGKNADTATNGGVTVDFEYGSGMTLSNGDDEIVIVDDSSTTSLPVEIARVAYGPDTDFPGVTAGASTQLGHEHDLTSVDPNDGALWCLSRERIIPATGGPSEAASDLGTPGAANSECALPTVTVTVQDLQDPSRPNHPILGSPVMVNNVIITAINAQDAWVQEIGGGQYSGVYMNVRNSDVTGFSVGDVVNVEGVYRETYDVTTIDNPVLTAASGTGTITVDEVLSSDFADPATAEPWEGALIRIVEPGTTNANPDAPADHKEFRIDGVLRVDDLLFNYPTEVGAPAVCDAFSSLTGVLHYTHGNYKLLPRDAADFPAPTAHPLAADEASKTVEVGVLGISPKTVCVSAGSEVKWEATAGQVTLKERNPITGAHITTSGFGGNASGFTPYLYTFSDAGILHYLGTDNFDRSIGNGRVIVAE